ncbi:MAG: hypothetical protein DMF73_17815 [Acidobacteria bacterium]|nr:MAG: hypothetical protein DMF73_17815 [Acidobacteriota bacterium]
MTPLALFLFQTPTPLQPASTPEKLPAWLTLIYLSGIGVETPAGRAHRAGKSAQRHSKASGRNHDQSRPASMALGIRAGGDLHFRLSRLLGALCRGTQSEISGTELQRFAQSTSF